MPKINDLVQNTDGRVYIYLTDDSICEAFLKDAEAEGFTFCDNVKPTSRQHDSIYAVNKDKTINYVGFVGHVAYMCADKIGEKPLIKVDYRELLNNNV